MPSIEYSIRHYYYNLAVLTIVIIGTESGLSNAEAAGIAIVLSSIVSFTAGLLVALVIAYCYIWQMTQKALDSRQPVHMYQDVTLEISRDIDLKENAAYNVIVFSFCLILFSILTSMCMSCDTHNSPPPC